jgi:hypothetical protein
MSPANLAQEYPFFQPALVFGKNLQPHKAKAAVVASLVLIAS